MISGSAMRKPQDFKNFLTNDDNKTQLCNILLQTWSNDLAKSRLKKSKSAIIVVDGKAYAIDGTGREVCCISNFDT